MSATDANDRDARYLAAQMQTNSRVLQMRERMQQARDLLHHILLQLDMEEHGELSSIPRSAPRVQVPLPALDRVESLPSRARTSSGTRLTSAIAADTSLLEALENGDDVYPDRGEQVGFAAPGRYAYRALVSGHS